MKINVGLIGLGCRGLALLGSELLRMEDVCVSAVCDTYEDRVSKAVDLIFTETGNRPFASCDYKEVLEQTLDAVIIATAWEHHVDIAVEAMHKGITVGLEVGGAYTIDQCWALVRAYEETGTHCMMLENCCYGKRELMLLNMVRQGVLGEIVHCSGGYCHDLREEIANGEENRHYRLRNYLSRNCENYPTHELLPIGKILNINNGNRMIGLTSTASCAKGLHEYCVANKGENHKLSLSEFKQGDIVNTVIKCANGETISIQLDTTLPRSYSRGFTVRGTKGAYFEDNDMIFIDGEHNEFEWKGRELWGNAASYEERFLHPLWRDYKASGGHGGMDWLVLRAFFDSVINKERPPIDVYDTATYMCISVISEESINQNSNFISIPDFTSGRWSQKRDLPSSKYSL